MREKNFAIMLDAVTDFEDVLQRMASLCRDAGEDDAASAACVAAEGLLALGRVMTLRGPTLPVPENVAG